MHGGGDSFRNIGSHLCERLLTEGADIVCLDNFFTGARRLDRVADVDRAGDVVRPPVRRMICAEAPPVFRRAGARGS
jgi:UDP-glucuronate decarboxylase